MPGPTCSPNGHDRQRELRLIIPNPTGRGPLVITWAKVRITMVISSISSSYRTNDITHVTRGPLLVSPDRFIWG